MKNDNNTHKKFNDNKQTIREEKFKTNLNKRLNKIEGQVSGIKSMIERDCYCDDILNQISAVRAALASVGKILLDSHIKNCVYEKIKNDDEQIIDEFIYTIGKFIK